MLREKLDLALDYIASIPSQLYGLILAVLLNELRKIFLAFTLRAIGLTPIRGAPTMEKPYDLKVLLEKLKARGVDLAEDALKLVIEETSAWVVESAALSPNKIDDLAAIGMPELKKLALNLADKVDGKEG